MSIKSVTLILRSVQKKYSTIELNADEATIDEVYGLCQDFEKYGELSNSEVDRLIFIAKAIDKRELEDNANEDEVGVRHRNLYRAGF